jgi:hypothetical protein
MNMYHQVGNHHNTIINGADVINVVSVINSVILKFAIANNISLAPCIILIYFNIILYVAE